MGKVTSKGGLIRSCVIRGVFEGLRWSYSHLVDAQSLPVHRGDSQTLLIWWIPFRQKPQGRTMKKLPSRGLLLIHEVDFLIFCRSCNIPASLPRRTCQEVNSLIVPSPRLACRSPPLPLSNMPQLTSWHVRLPTFIFCSSPC